LNDIDFSLLWNITIVLAKDYLDLAFKWDLEVYNRLAKIALIDLSCILVPKLMLTSRFCKTLDGNSFPQPSQIVCRTVSPYKL
jgi:hypothetical protein